jgi:NB-ARC domain
LLVPFKLMKTRVSVAREESDTALFFHLLYFGEMVVKLTAAGLVAAIQDDRERHRYRLLFRLVRADGIGEWSTVIDDILTGPAAQFLTPAARMEQRELTQRTQAGTWQFDAVQLLSRNLEELDRDREKLPAKVDGRRWFSLFAVLRNRTRGHGASQGTMCSRLAPALERSIDLITNNFRLYQRPWAFLYRNLSKKYRVTRLTESSDSFDYLRFDGSRAYENGIYVHFDSHAKVELIHSDPEAGDFFFPNGSFTDKRYELISYLSDNKQVADSGPYLTPSTELPSSRTHGIGLLDQQGNSFANLPPLPTNYVPRPELEDELFGKLTDDRHPVITVRGTGGIGKTSLAITVLHKIAKEGSYGAIVWFSARDIDLLRSGPKDVRPQVLTEDDIAAEFVQLMHPSESSEKEFKADKYLADSLGKSPVGSPMLFIFDNFETVRSPGALYTWIDTYIRNPNKILITTRFSDFKGDYPLEVLGMSEGEADQLITETAYNLGIRKLVTPDYRKDLHRESDGHPYVIKILLGEVAKAGQLQKIERIISNRADILGALFERTYSGLSPAAKFVFMILCNWRSTIPQLAVEAVLLRPVNEKFDAEASLEELKKSSLVESRVSGDGTTFLSVPLVAAIFGKRKLSVSAEKSVVESNTEILRFLGAAQKTDIQHGIEPRLRAMFSQFAQRVGREPAKLADYLPVMEFIASKFPPAWLLLAQLYEESLFENGLERAKEATRHFLELGPQAEARLGAWKKLGQYCRLTGDWNGEIHALAGMVEVPTIPFEDISNAANRVNGLLATHQFLDSEERKLLVARVAAAMEDHVLEFDATDCSRLAWLFMRIRQEERARALVQDGLDMEPRNEYCLKLSEKLAQG